MYFPKSAVCFCVLWVLLGFTGIAGCQKNDDTSPAPGGGTPESGNGSGATPSKGPRLIVKFKSVVGASGGLMALTDGVFQPLPSSPHSKFGSKAEAISLNLYRVSAVGQTHIDDLRQELAAQPDVEYVETDVQFRTFHIPNDPDYSKVWSHAVVRSEEAWDLSKGSGFVTIAVIDTGVDHTHPDLKANLWVNSAETPGNGIGDDRNGFVDDVHGYDFVNNDSDPQADDSNLHGTHCAGTVGAVGDNGIGISGHSPQVKLMALKFIGGNGSGSASDAVRAIDYAIAKKVQIMSNSWGSTQGSQAIQEAIRRAESAGILFVVAAGNGGQDGIGDNNDQVPTYPAAYRLSNVLAVAATDQSDSLTRFSNYGPQGVHVAAPGLEIYSTKNGGTYQKLSGTSMATPLVAGVAATIYAKKAGVGYQAVKEALIKGSDPVSSLQGRVVANGRINAAKAVNLIGGGPAPTPTPTPQPTPTPSPTPSPTPQPGQVAQDPKLAGQNYLLVTNPYVQIPVDWNIAEFAEMGASQVYLEVSKPNQSFANPNGDRPDPNRLSYAMARGLRGRFVLLPAQNLPGWGVYQLRLIPLNSGNWPVGLFSNSSVLELRPQ